MMLKDILKEGFESIFVGSGSPVIKCEYCGRIHFSSDSEFYDETELQPEDYFKKQEKEPNKYSSHPEDSISWGVIFRKQFVAGCECDPLKDFRDFVERRRADIAHYLEFFSQEHQREADQASDAAQKIR